MRITVRHIIAVAMLAATLSACTPPGGNADDGMARFFVAPDKYVIFNCDQLAIRATVVAARQKELQALMAQAENGSDGRLVSALAYRPEYVTLRGDMIELRQTAAAKNCKSVPTLDEPVGRASDNVVR